MRVSRREFLGMAAGAAVAAGNAERVLVAVQLAGGNDGLNTVVPYEDDEYGRARTTLRLRGDQVLKIGAGLGFHPELGAMRKLFGEGRLAVVQGVGYANMHRDHNVGMKNWQTAHPAEGDQETGWLGRAADRMAEPDPASVPAVFVGRIPQPLTVHARRIIVPSLQTARDWTPLTAGTNEAAPRTDPLADFVARASAAARGDARKVSAAGRASAYPPLGLAQSLETVAQFIRAGIGIRIFLVELGGGSPGGFDNHSNQAANQAVVLRELSDSLAAFADDLARDRLLDRVLVMTYSEFGRTLTENGRHGTGHGAAAPIFLAGGKVKGGLIGAHPSLKDLDADAPKPHTDFRAVYATVLERWLGVESEPILGARFAPLDVLA
jgi:uncharacterized protein (DUF1501 family)